MLETITNEVTHKVMLSQHQGLAKNRFQSECPHQQSVTFSAGEKEKRIPNVKVKNIKGGLA